MAQSSLEKLSDKELFLSLETLSSTENETTVNVIMHLIELEKRRSYLELGYHSLFDYMRRKLKYSEGGAMRRITAARCLRDYPALQELLLKRDVSLSTVAVFASILTRENQAVVLKEVSGKSKVDVERYVAAYRPEAKAKKESVKPVVIAKKKETVPAESSLELFSAKAAKAPSVQAQKPMSAGPVPEPAEERFEPSSVWMPTPWGSLTGQKF